MPVIDKPYDVVICGGGLAGLTLALQLRKEQPERSVLVVERQKRPLPDACHKVGESSVEIGAHYFEKVVGLRKYLDERQLRKNGLRFYSGVPGAPIHERCELGPSERPVVPSFQLDRGRLENDLRAMVEESGATLLEGWGVRDIELDEESDHTIVLVDEEGAVHRARARWAVDATGRRRILQKKLGHHRDSVHQAGASWWRVKGRFDIKDLVDPSAERWHARDIHGNRWLSTIHLCGTGYWFWLIPLSTDHWSLGIVAEAASHDFRTFGKPETAKEWVRKYEPHVWKKLEGLPWEDFIAFKDYRYDSARVMSADRWTCVGEAGVFVDPLYSPGSDFIGVSNSFTCQLIADDFAGKLTRERADELNRFMLRFEDLTSETLALGSQVFGKPEVVAGKLYWDYLQYWAFMCQYFFQRIYTVPVEEHRKFSALLDRWCAMNHRAQTLLQEWARIAPHEPSVEFVHLPQFPSTLADLHLDLQTMKTPDECYRDMERAIETGKECLSELVLRALRRAGPENARAFAERIELAEWEIEIDEQRLLADEAEPKQRRKLLPKSIRDMERAIGKTVPEQPGAPHLRELWTIAAS